MDRFCIARRGFITPWSIALNQLVAGIAACTLEGPLLENHYMERFYGGDEEAMDELHAMFYRRLVRRAAARLPTRLPARQQLAEDLVGEVFAKVVRTRSRPASRWQASKGDVGKWLSGILYKQIASHLRRKRGKERVTSDVTGRDNSGRTRCLEMQLVAVQENAEEQFAARQARDQVEQAMGELPEESRQLLRLRYWFDQPYREIGRQMGVSVPTVSRRVHAAHETLRRKLGAARFERRHFPELFA